ncbi:hypothetical protein DAI18_18040 [Microvirgula aerodenitrificans]|uniref:Uncharacterized protein n=1 Tax=Microvirgula aerodenitrificans TaxID=57480 RepID=A0A2S0PEE3_9NEIS|nr:hypothetical protein [Microvirgula aerodenitrificans]AVY95731.1 hypothetical protein DAI18_18040 [Microvirgula aerodenitrificans]
MDDYLTRVAEAVRDATLACAWQIGDNGPLRSAVKLPKIIASVPRPEPVAAWAAGTAAIEFALEDATGEGMAFLRCWLYGDFDVIRNEWPEAPESVYIGADPLHPETVAMLAAAPEEPQPVLDRPASIGGTTFGVGIPVRTLVAAAQRRYEAEQTPASLADRQALIDALRHPVVDAELTTLREQNAALKQDAARYHALRAELIRAAGPVDERGEIEKAIKEVMRKAYAERGDPMPTAAEFDTAIDISIASAEGGAA